MISSNKTKLTLVCVYALVFVCSIFTSCQKRFDKKLSGWENTSPRDVTESQFTISATTTNAPADAGNYPASYAIDNSYSTHWSGKTDGGDSTWIMFDLGIVKSVTSVKISFYTGGSTTRTSNFDIAVSADGKTGWVTTYYHQNSTANTTALLSYGFNAVKGRYIRISGHGNNTAAPNNIWNSYNEVQIWGADTTVSNSARLTTYEALVSANGHTDPYYPSNVVDDDTSTIWSAHMADSTDYKFVALDLDNVYLMDNIKISFYNGGNPTRKTAFSVEVSMDSSNWTQVVPYSFSTPNTTELETFDFQDIQAQYIRVKCYGNNGTTSRLYNSLYEVQVWGKPIGTVDVVADWETGNHSQWYGFDYHDSSAQYATVTNPIRQGTYAGKFIVRPGDTIVGNYNERCEVSMWKPRANPYNAYTKEKLGDEYYYGFSTMFPVGWQQPTGWGITTQWQVTANGTNPAITFNAREDALEVDFSTGTFRRPPDSSNRYGFAYYQMPYAPNNPAASPTILTSLSKGTWHDFIVHIKFEPDSTGICEIWHRLEGQIKFQKVLDYSGTHSVPTEQWMTTKYYASDSSVAFTKGGVPGWVPMNYVKMGLYRARTSLGGITNTIYHDNWCRGTAYSAIRARFN